MLKIPFPRLEVSKPLNLLLQEIISRSPDSKEGSGTPEGVITAPPGTLYVNSAGGLGTSLYLKETGDGDTGWAAVQAGGLSATWGLIGGTLTDQLDLVAALALKEGTITAGTTAQYWRGDKSWQTLDRAAVGLGNVDNTSDLNKPVSTATQAAIDAKVGVLWNVRVLTASATAAAGDWCDCDATSGAITITLPSVATNTGKTILVCKTDSSGNAVTIAGTINGATNLDITVQYTVITLSSNGTEWRII